MIDKVKASADEAVAPVQDGAVIMAGGFMNCGTPRILIDALVKKGVSGLTIISNDAGLPGEGVGKLISSGQVKTLIAGHVGLNPEVARRSQSTGPDRLELILVPIGTIAERIRAAGAGLGGILTPTGVGTVAAEGKQVIRVDGRDYLLEKPLRADFALIRASRIDRFGNAVFYGTTRNFNPVMAAAADYVIAAACEIVEIGSIAPDAAHLSGIWVNAIAGGEKP
ncbi:MAG: CoA transferase subunit A [Treponema sp.]|jgi:acetate CoA/acetoacetate CoA-transferase alpha subunit|nr:CoA transferase subunit A [Treponema sp.]